MEERERERTGRCELLYHFPCTFRILPMQLRTAQNRSHQGQKDPDTWHCCRAAEQQARVTAPMA